MKYIKEQYITNTDSTNREILFQLKGLWKSYRNKKDSAVLKQIQEYGSILDKRGYKRSNKRYGRTNNSFKVARATK